MKNEGPWEDIEPTGSFSGGRSVEGRTEVQRARDSALGGVGGVLGRDVCLEGESGRDPPLFTSLIDSWNGRKRCC